MAELRVPVEAASTVFGRRSVLRGLVLLGGVAFLAPKALFSLRARAAGTPAFRLSTRGQDACNACKAHAAHRYYETKADADADRAHKGCNCKIVEHKLDPAVLASYFGAGSTSRKVFDDRRDLAYPPPTTTTTTTTTPTTTVTPAVQGDTSVKAPAALPRTT
jgi:hypothetical protein